ncbi:MAG TPA: hypothetical protein VG346_11980 [Acidimicrobiales bacterium]|jgi:hypothetical protein|nr:hypothetical protein [Acidimicrobiales bacterium]
MIVAVVGKGRNCPPEVADIARFVGYAVGAAGHVLVCGGLGGVMDAAAAGAAMAGATVIGLVPNQDPPNDNCTIALATGLPPTVRNIVVGSCCDALLALGGSHGTMQEIAVALDREVPVAAVETDRWIGLVPERIGRDHVPAWLAQVELRRSCVA